MGPKVNKSLFSYCTVKRLSRCQQVSKPLCVLCFITGSVQSRPWFPCNIGGTFCSSMNKRFRKNLDAPILIGADTKNFVECSCSLKCSDTSCNTSQREILFSDQRKKREHCRKWKNLQHRKTGRGQKGKCWKNGDSKIFKEKKKEIKKKGKNKKLSWRKIEMLPLHWGFSFKMEGLNSSFSLGGGLESPFSYLFWAFQHPFL